MESGSEAAAAGDEPLVPAPAAAREPWPVFFAAVLRIALNSFGGPIAQIGVMHQELVERRRWVTEGQFLRLLGFANILPGPEALELLIHLGYLRRGVAGGIAAGLLFIAPGFVSLTTLAWIYVRFGQLPIVVAVMDGIRPIAVALIAAAVMRLSAKSLVGWRAYTIAVASFLASYLAGAPFLAVLLGAGLVGLLVVKAPGRSPPAVNESRTVSRLRAAVLIVVLAGTGVLGAVRAPPPDARPAAVAAPRGQASLTDIALVNTRTALMTFGGAYTAFPYMREQYVERRGWLTDTDVLVALALGETTPGPLITVGVFLAQLAAGFRGAVVGGLFLFLPSFVLVLVLGRHLHRVERLRGAGRFIAGVSAATIGLIVALAAEVTPQNIRDPFGVVLAVAALVAATRLRQAPLVLVAVGAFLGIARHLLP